MGARSKARKRAVDILYAAELRGVNPMEVLTAAQDRPTSHDTPPVPAYTATLVAGVARNRGQIDALLSASAQDWTLERMPAVDRNILRVATLELLHADDVPDGVAVSEAVELASALSTEESPRFVNGVLARIVRDRVGALAADGDREALLVASETSEPDFPV